MNTDPDLQALDAVPDPDDPPNNADPNGSGSTTLINLTFQDLSFTNLFIMYGITKHPAVTLNLPTFAGSSYRNVYSVMTAQEPAIIYVLRYIINDTVDHTGQILLFLFSFCGYKFISTSHSTFLAKDRSTISGHR
jgi:hypothetical protein